MRYMHKAVNDILIRITTDEEKKKSLDSLADDIEMARGILSGHFKHCPKCNDYYLRRSFIQEIERKEGKVCVYQDPINSGGNEYKDGYIVTTYQICPKNHKITVSVEEEERKR